MAPRRLVCCALLFLTTAIDCYHMFSAQRVSNQALPAGCMAAALSASPEVAEVKGPTVFAGQEVFTVVLDDSTARKNRREVAIWHRADTTGSDVLEVSENWALLNGPSSVEKQSLANLAARVLTEVQAQCAPGDSTPVQCEFDSKSLQCA